MTILLDPAIRQLPLPTPLGVVPVNRPVLAAQRGRKGTASSGRSLPISYGVSSRENKILFRYQVANHYLVDLCDDTLELL
jgi:hypothetical protein